MSFPSDELAVVISELEGKSQFSLASTVRAAWVVVGYGLNLVIPDSTVNPPAMTTEAALGHLKGLHAAYKTQQALPPISWAQLIQLLLEFIQQWLAGNGGGALPQLA